MALRFDKLTILVVEDMEPMAQMIGSVLDALGVGKIVIAHSGNEGFALTQRYNPDIIIADWLMEPVNGIDMIRQIRKHPGSPNRTVPILMLTGFNAKARVMEARDAGVTEFLVKPFSAEDLARRLSHIINKPRDFVDNGAYFGPDRRRKTDEAYNGDKRRQSDNDSSEKWEITI